MKKKVFFATVLVMILICLINYVSATDISSCQTISSSGVYTLTQNVSSSGTCMNISSANVILDCNGYTINFSSSSEGDGVYSNSENTTVRNCFIRESSEQNYSYGIYFNGGNNSFIDNCNIFTQSNSGFIYSASYGIYLYGADNNSVTNTNTTTAGFFTFGMYFYDADYNNVTNFHQIGSYGGITLAGASYNNFVNSSSIASIDNLCIQQESSNNNFTGCHFESGYASGVFVTTSDQNSFVNCVLASGVGRSIYLTYAAGEYNLTNCTVTSLTMVEGGRLNVFWLADVYVSDIGGNPINNANVSVYDNAGQLVSTSLTNSSGYVQRIAIQESMQNATAVYSRNPHNITGTASGYYFNSTPITLTENLIDSNKIVLSLLSEGDNPAIVVLNSPSNAYKSGYQSVIFNCTGSDDFNLTNVTLYGNWTGSWQANETNSSPINNYPTIFTKTISDGYYSWNCKACDNSSQCSYAINRTFRVETFPPIASQGTNPIDNFNSNSSNITFDLKCSSNVSVSWIQLWTNTTGIWVSVYSNSSYANNTWLNITLNGISDAQNYKWAIYCNDTEGKSDWTSNRTFNVETGSNLISYCRALNEANTIYTLSQNVSSEGTCFNVNANNVTLDCNGFAITFANSWVSGAGVYSNSPKTTIKNCIIKEGSDADYSYGIEFYGVSANNGIIDNSSVANIGSSIASHGIYFNGARNNTIINTNMSSSGYISYSLYLFGGADYNTLINCNGRGSWGGMGLEASNYNNFVNVSSISEKESLYFIEGSNYNNFTGCYFESNSSLGVAAYASEKNSFVNSVLSGSGSISLASSYTGEYNLTNCTLIGEVEVSYGTLNVFWLADVYANDSNGNPINGASVVAKTTRGTLANSSLTNSSGYTPRLTLREYKRNATGTYPDTNYIINASKNGYGSNLKSVNLTSNAIEGYLGKVVLTLSPTSAPNISSFDDYTITLPNQVTLAALVTSDSDFTTEWSQVSGPGEVTFSNPDYSVTDVTFSSPGGYVLRLEADDGRFSRYQEVSVTVLPEPLSLKIKKSGTGTGNVSGTGITCGSDCEETFEDNTIISLNASSASGSVFAGWVGSGCLGNSSNVCNITVNGTKEVTAFFDTNTTGIHVYYVATNGSDSNNGSSDFPWLTIQHAADTAVAGDKVIVKAGIYNEFLEFPNSGNATSPIVFEGERDADGNWLTIVDPSVNASSGWIAAPEIGDGVWKKDFGFNTSALQINNKKVASVLSMEDMSIYINNVYNNTGWITGADLLSVPADASVYTIPTWGSYKLRYWDGLEALWGASGTITYLRLRNGSSPNGMNIRATPPITNWWTPATFLITENSYLDFRNFNVRNSKTQFLLQGNTHNLTIESNFLSTGVQRVWLYAGPYQNTIRNNEMTNNIYGFNDPGAESNSADYRNSVRQYQYLVSKLISGGGGSNDYGVALTFAGNNNIISGNHIFKGIGMGIGVEGYNFTNPTLDTEIYGNVIENEPSIGILLRCGETGTKVHDNLLMDNAINLRLMEMDTVGELNRIIYIYRNKFWLPENAGEHIFAHFLEDPDATYDPEVWIYQNSFTGGYYGLGNGGGNPPYLSMPNISSLNNIFSGVTFSVLYGSRFGENASAMGIFDYNLLAPLYLPYFPPYPVWYGEHNLNQSSPVWNLYEVPDFSLQHDSIAIDSGIDLSQPFTINGTEYPALPGMELGYFTGDAPDMGAIEYDPSIPEISRNAPENNYNSNSHDIVFEFKCYYNSSIGAIQLWTNTTGEWKVNYSNNSYTSNTWLNKTLSGIPDGQNYKWAVFCNGTNGNSSFKGNRTFNVDTVAPTAYQGTNPVEGYQDSTGEITLDLKCSDDIAVQTIQLLTDKSGILQADYYNSSYQNDTWLNITLDGITSGNYIWEVYCEDIAGNSDTTSLRAFSSTYAEEEEEEEQKKGGGGGGGGSDEENATNQTNMTNVNNNLNNVSNSVNNITPDNNADEENQDTENKTAKNNLQKYWWLILATVVVIAGLIILGSIKKKESF